VVERSYPGVADRLRAGPRMDRDRPGALRSAMITSVTLPVAELSSVASALDELTRRVTEIARRAADEGDDSATELFAAERALRGAQRRLAKLATPPRRPSTAG
jgi:hypothetical protein